MLDVDDPHILVAIKKTRWEHYADQGDGDAAVPGVDSESDVAEKLRDSHRVHRSGVEDVVEHLESEGYSHRVEYRGDVEETGGYDLIVTVGGDGTVLDLSHKVRDVPILAVNSHPESSVGYFCAGTAGAFPALLKRALRGDLESFDLLRYHLRIDGDLEGPPVLNDILISHSNPAAVSRYLLETATGDPEYQRSSGIWVATPAGSTAAIRSAGGSVLPLGCNCIEYVVREPYPLPGEPYRQPEGIQPIHEPLRVRSRMQSGRVFVDGPHISREFDVDELVSIDPEAPNLTVFGLDVARRISDR